MVHPRTCVVWAVLGLLASPECGHAQERARGLTLLNTAAETALARPGAGAPAAKTFGSGAVKAVIASEPRDAGGCWRFAASLTGELANVQSVRWSFGSGDGQRAQVASQRASGFQVVGQTCRAEPFRAAVSLKRARGGSRSLVVEGTVSEPGGDSGLPDGLSFERVQEVEKLESEIPMGVRTRITLKGAALEDVRSVEYRSNQPNWRGGWYSAPNVNGFAFDGSLPPGRWTITARITMKDGRTIERRFDVDAGAQ